MIDRLREYGINVRPGSRGDVKTVCPKCSHTRKHRTDPCLSVNVEKGVWNCHNCDFKGAVREVKEYVKPPAELKKVSQSVIDWFAGRGISNQTLLRYQITEGIDYMPQVGQEVKTIHFNYFYHGELVNIKYRDSGKNFKMVANARLVPYGIDICSDNSSDDVVICEGEIDVLSFYEVGIPAISVPNGASNRQLDWLNELDLDGKRILLATDMDAPGQALREELARRLGKENCWIVDLPRKDANEVLCELGRDALRACIDQAKPYPVEGIDDAGSVQGELVAMFEQGPPSGWESMDFVWHPGQVTIVTGIPGHGKSTYVKNVVARLAEQHGLKFFIYSAEEASTATALADLFAIRTGKGFYESHYGPRMTREEMEEEMPFIADHFKYYRLSDNDLTIEGILAKAKEMVRQYGIHGLVIDNMSTVEKSMSHKNDARNNQIQAMLSDITRFAKNHGVHVFLVAHPKKMVEIRTGIYKVPNGYDISDSAHWYNLPDNGFTVYRNFETMQTEIHRWKVRHRHSGVLGTEYYEFTPYNSTYHRTEKLNDGSDRTLFVGQPTDKKDIENFARLADHPQGKVGQATKRGTGTGIPR